MNFTKILVLGGQVFPKRWGIIVFSAVGENHYFRENMTFCVQRIAFSVELCKTVKRI